MPRGRLAQAEAEAVDPEPEVLEDAGVDDELESLELEVLDEPAPSPLDADDPEDEEPPEDPELRVSVL